MKKLAFAAALLVAAAMTAAHAEDYPTRTVTIIVPFAPGGPADVTGRSLADILSRHLDNPSSSRMSAAPAAPSDR